MDTDFGVLREDQQQFIRDANEQGLKDLPVKENP
jgi:hypothetical protein